MSSEASSGKIEPQKLKIDEKDITHSDRPAKRPRLNMEQSDRKVIDLDDSKMEEISSNSETKTDDSQSTQMLPPAKDDEHQFQYKLSILHILDGVY